MRSELTVSLPSSTLPELDALLVELAGSCTIVPVGPTSDREAARAAMVAEPGPWPVFSPDVRLAVVVRTASEAHDAGTRPGVVAVLCHSSDAMRAAGSRAMRVPAPDGHAEVALPMPPHVRTRLARAHGRAADSVAVVAPDGSVSLGGRAVDRDLIETVLGLAAVVVATTPHALRRALAWAAPTVTDAESAAAVDVEDDVEVVVSTPDLMMADAVLLAGDPIRAARLSRRGRAWYEERHDAAHTAARLVVRLGLLPKGERRLDALADEMGAPPTARSRGRARQLVAGLDAREVNV